MTNMTHEKKDEITLEVQEAIKVVFAGHFKDMLGEPSPHPDYATKADYRVDMQVVNANEDSGGWAPSAVAVIYHEGDIPCYGGTHNINAWTEVSNRLFDEHSCYIEPINNAVSAVFEIQ